MDCLLVLKRRYSYVWSRAGYDLNRKDRRWEVVEEENVDDDGRSAGQDLEHVGGSGYQDLEHAANTPWMPSWQDLVTTDQLLKDDIQLVQIAFG